MDSANAITGLFGKLRLKSLKLVICNYEFGLTDALHAI